MSIGTLVGAVLVIATCGSGRGAGVAGASCSTDGDCAEGLICVVRVCTATVASCTSDEQCPGGACVEGFCSRLAGGAADAEGDSGGPDQMGGRECDDDDDCLDGDPCTTDTCDAESCHHEDVEGCCNLDLECDDGSEFTLDACVDNLCEHTPAQIPCLHDGECDDGDFCTSDECVEGICENTPSDDPLCCNTADECDDGDDTTVDLCVENSCTWTNCTSDIDCEDDNDCSEQACEEGVCAYTVLTTPDCACVTDADCSGKGGACTLVQTGPTTMETYCVNAEGPKMGGVDCAANEECHSGLCMGLTSGENLCFQGCLSDTECTAGTKCSSVIYGQGTADEMEFPACLPAPTQCSGDVSCAEGEICLPTENQDLPSTIITVCAPPAGGQKTAGQGCAADAECQSAICIAVIGTEESVCWSACVGDGDCAPELKCYVNMLYFVFDQGTPLELSDDTQYSMGSCMPDLGTYTQCLGDTDCIIGEFCYPGNNQTATEVEPRCLASWSTGSTPGGADCTADDQCLSGMCINAPVGFCLGLCKSDADCFGTTTCQTYDSFVVDDKNTPNVEEDDVLDSVDVCLP